MRAVAGSDCTVPYFGFKAKLKTVVIIHRLYCTVPYFGFKAKLWTDGSALGDDCTVPYFGFKAKRPHESYRG